VQAKDGLLLNSSVLISYDLWKRRYGMDPTVVGRPILIGSYRSLVIAGVAEPGFHFPDPAAEVWIALPAEILSNSVRASLRGMIQRAVGRLRDGVSQGQAERDLQRLIQTFPTAFPDVNEQQLAEMDLRAQVVPLKTEIVGEARFPLLLLLMTTAFLLLITWANATNMSLIRAERLRRELAVARALGAGNRDLLHRFLPESFALAFIAGALGFVLASIAIGTQFGFRSDQIPRLNEVRMDVQGTLFILTLTLMSAALLGSVSLISARRVDASRALMGSMGRAGARPEEQRWRRVLVVTQVALALPLLIGSTLMAKSFFNLVNVDLGFQPRDGVTFTLPVPPTQAKSGDFYHDVAEIQARVRDRLRALPGVEAAESSGIFPLTPTIGSVRVAANREDNVENLQYGVLGHATPGYFRVMGIPILYGRTFETNDLTPETPGAILSASLARSLFGREDVVGKQVSAPSSSSFFEFVPHTVVGVVGDIAAKSIADGPSKVMYFPNIYPPRPPKVEGVISIHIPNVQRYIVRTRLPLASLSRTIQQIVRDVEPTLVATQIGTVQQRVGDSMARARLTMLLLAIGAGTALFLGLMGLYGVLAFAVGQRTSEFGIRIALGASPAMIVRMVIRQGVLLAVAGIAVGTLVSMWLTTFLSTLLYQVSPNDPAAFAMAAVFLIAVAALASYLPAHRAGKTDTVQALKAE
jgi:predicted permease